MSDIILDKAEAEECPYRNPALMNYECDGQIDGLVSLNVYPDCLSSSNIDVTMEMLFENEDAFKNYKINPLKIAAEKEVLVPYQNDVIAADYMV